MGWKCTIKIELYCLAIITFADEIDMEIVPSSRPQSEDEMEVEEIPAPPITTPPVPPASTPLPPVPPPNFNLINFLDLSNYVDSLDNDTMQQMNNQAEQFQNTGVYGTEPQVGAAYGTEVGTGMYGAEVGMYEQGQGQGQVETQVETTAAGEQNPSTSTDSDIPALKSEERVAKKVFEYMKAAEEQPKKKPKQIRNDHLLAKMEEILTEVKKLTL